MYIVWHTVVSPPPPKRHKTIHQSSMNLLMADSGISYILSQSTLRQQLMKLIFSQAWNFSICWKHN